VAFEASYLPFPRTEAERPRTGDPRRSISERYSGREDYMDRYKDAVGELVKQRWILAEDRGALVDLGEREWELATK
jgi:hypothetical protein